MEFVCTGLGVRVRTEIYLPGTPKNAMPLKHCQGACDSPKPPEAGVQVSASKWVCASCWRLMNSRKK
jgi:hypothetical protein